jgi:uncharacterized membrane protein
MDKSFFQKMQEQCKKYVVGHTGAIIGGFLGLLFAILLFTFGLFKMLVVALFVLVGVAIGQIFDGKATILTKVRSLFTDRN